MIPAVVYARVSSKDQEREGFSIPAQLKLLREYARSRNFKIAQEFVDVETAKTTGRKKFGEMVRFLIENKGCRVLIVEKTDRLYRNFKDCVTLEDLEVEIHLAKEGQIISKEAKSQTKLAHGIQVVIARNFVENLKEEVRKGMRQKAEQGIYPSRPPMGYRNNKVERTIEVDPARAPVAVRAFELYGTGEYSLSTLKKALATDFGISVARAELEKILKNRFYIGLFYWQGTLYNGTQTPLISRELFERVQDVFRGHNRPKYRNREFAFAGLLKCAFDDCTVTAEIKKGKYTYYHCTGFRGKCGLPYFREEDLANRLGGILKDIHIPDEILDQLNKSLLGDRDREREVVQQERERLGRRLAEVRRRIDQAYVDKVDGKIPEEFWQRKSAEWQGQEQQILTAISALDGRSPEYLIDAARALELANKAYFLYLRQKPTEQAKLLRIVVSNCAVDAVNVYPTYRKPFDLIFTRAKKEEWYARVDSNHRPRRSGLRSPLIHWNATFATPPHEIRIARPSDLHRFILADAGFFNVPPKKMRI